MHVIGFRKRPIPYNGIFLHECFFGRLCATLILYYIFYSNDICFICYICWVLPFDITITNNLRYFIHDKK